MYKRSVYYKMTNLITVGDLMTPLGPDVISGESSIDAYERIMEVCAYADYPYDPMMRASLVKHNGEVIGIAYPDLLGVDVPVGEGDTMDVIQPARIISSATKILRFIEIIQFDQIINHLVIDEDTFVGTIDIFDLTKMPFRLCLLALTLDLEQLIMQYALKDPNTSWSYLSNERRKAAQSLFFKKQHRSLKSQGMEVSSKLLLDYTSFSDKCKMLKASGLMRKIHETRRVDFLPIINHAISFRNVCAHSTHEDKLFELFQIVNIKDFTNNLRTLNHELLQRVLNL